MIHGSVTEGGTQFSFELAADLHARKQPNNNIANLEAKKQNFGISNRMLDVLICAQCRSLLNGDGLPEP